jgi:hypothetical protein
MVGAYFSDLHGGISPSCSQARYQVLEAWQCQ